MPQKPLWSLLPCLRLSSICIFFLGGQSPHLVWSPGAVKLEERRKISVDELNLFFPCLLIPYSSKRLGSLFTGGFLGPPFRGHRVGVSFDPLCSLPKEESSVDWSPRSFSLSTDFFPFFGLASFLVFLHRRLSWGLAQVLHLILLVILLPGLLECLFFVFVLCLAWGFFPFPEVDVC
jgi:hypothetical protein